MHRLVDADGAPARLGHLGDGEVALVAFVYLSCPHVCPRTLGVMRELDRSLPEAVRGRVRLVAVSFDPARDTPERMAGLRENLQPRGPWRFLTAGSEGQLAPVLADYGQRVVPLDRPHDPLFRHVLKVFLLDDARRVRNIYSAGFLDARLMRNDILTVLEEIR